MEVQCNCLVRVYRHDGTAMTGTVEAVDTGEIVPFRSAAELWSALQQSSFRRRMPSTTKENDQ